VRHVRETSRIPAAATSGAMRRATRPRSRLMRNLPFDDRLPPQRLLTRIDAGEVTASPPKRTPPGVATVDQVADVVARRLPPPARALRTAAAAPSWLARLLARVLVALAAAVRRRIGHRRLGRALATLLEGGARRLAVERRAVLVSASMRGPDAIREANLTPQAVDALPKSPDFRVTPPRSPFTPRPGPTDSAEAVRFKSALRDWHALAQATAAAGRRPTLAALGLGDVTKSVLVSIDPQQTIPRRTLAGIEVPRRIADALDDSFQEVMAYPVIDLPMYEPLKDSSPDRFVPNLDLITANSITLLEVNQPFIEAYMTGLNHEFARELLWREYPSDNRATCFRQFWDVRGFLDPRGGTDEARRERLRDIPPLHLWPPASHLGEHDQRQGDGTGAEVVLVIRGELLKKYPTAVIYAHHAAWQPLGGTPDPSLERVLQPLTAAEEDGPPRTKVRTPLYEAKVDPDLYFFGFDLKVETAKGQDGTRPDDDAGWFFVVKERPGEPRFGLDIDRQGPIETFNDLAWSDALPAGQPGDMLQATSLASVTLAAPGPAGLETEPQFQDDVKVAPAPPSSARWAYVLYQAPVMVAVHAAEML
jgi:hypothetical protein